MFIDRYMNLGELLEENSHFLFGPRQTGKSTLIETQLQDCFLIDLLDGDDFERYLKRPRLLGDLLEKADTQVVVIDEIQLLPSLLDEVQRLMKAKKWRFLLTGSSARKLKKKGTNLLGGRAWVTHLYPLTFSELGETFDLNQYLNRGGLPHIYSSKSYAKHLKTYCQVYLKQEIQDEGLVRNLKPFREFLEIMARIDGQEFNKTAIARDCGVSDFSINGYIEILEDTLIGYRVPAFTMTKKRKPMRRSRFYFFDVGVVNSLAGWGKVEEASPLYGRLFEHFIVGELRAYLGYNDRDQPLSYWRSQSGFEVDAIIGSDIAIECKATPAVKNKHLSGLKALQEEGVCKDFYLVSRDPISREVDGIILISYAEFLTKLWAGDIF